MKVGTAELSPKEVAEVLRAHVEAKFGTAPSAIHVIDPWGKACLAISFESHGAEHLWDSSETRQVTKS